MIIKCPRCGENTKQGKEGDYTRRVYNSCRVVYDYCPNCKKLFPSDERHITSVGNGKYYTTCQW